MTAGLLTAIEIAPDIETEAFIEQIESCSMFVMELCCLFVGLSGGLDWGKNRSFNSGKGIFEAFGRRNDWEGGGSSNLQF